MTPVRLGAVGYLNARPLVYGLDRESRFAVRFDAPSRCAELLHEGGIDVGLIPSVEYLRGPGGYAVVPEISIASMGPVASVALFSRGPLGAIRSIAADRSSRTSIALLRVLCAWRFGIAPEIRTAAPDFEPMLAQADAALVIGDPALFVDHQALGLTKIDLGAEWTALTGLPFVWAFWAGRPQALGPADVRLLQAARDAGVAAADEVARAYSPDDEAKSRRGGQYLRENIQYGLGDRERDGLRRFYDETVALGLVPRVEPLRWYER